MATAVVCGTGEITPGVVEPIEALGSRLPELLESARRESVTRLPAVTRLPVAGDVIAPTARVVGGSWDDVLTIAEACDDECAHAEARALWPAAVAAFGSRAHELRFLQSRATAPQRGRGATAAARRRYA